MARYKTYKIDKSPTEKFPNMVTISKKIKGNIMEKKFISQEKAMVWIEAIAAETLITRGAKKVKGELSSIGIVKDTAW